jgi:hypothetical protein
MRSYRTGNSFGVSRGPSISAASLALKEQETRLPDASRISYIS